MITEKILCQGNITLRQIELEDCTTTYVEWLNNPDVNQYLETKWSQQTMESVRNFVISQRGNEHSILFAIMWDPDGGRERQEIAGRDNRSGQHIGNIKIGPINEHYRHADISYFIGDKALWNKGIATEAIRLVTEFGFDELKLHRVEAGAYAAAVGSWKALEKNGFVREAVFREQVISNGNYMDVYRYGILEPEFLACTKHTKHSG